MKLELQWNKTIKHCSFDYMCNQCCSLFRCSIYSILLHTKRHPKEWGITWLACCCETDATIASWCFRTVQVASVNFRHCSGHWYFRYSVQRIVHNHLKFLKVSAQCMPKQLKPEQQAMRMMTSLDNLQCYKTEREAMLERIVTINEN